MMDALCTSLKSSGDYAHKFGRYQMGQFLILFLMPPAENATGCTH